MLVLVLVLVLVVVEERQQSEGWWKDLKRVEEGDISIEAAVVVVLVVVVLRGGNMVLDPEMDEKLGKGFNNNE